MHCADMHEFMALHQALMQKVQGIGWDAQNDELYVLISPEQLPLVPTFPAEFNGSPISYRVVRKPV